MSLTFFVCYLASDWSVENVEYILYNFYNK